MTKDKFYQRLWFKNTVLISIPSIISLIGVIISFVPSYIKIILGCFCIFFMLCLIVAVIFFANQDDKIYKELDDLKNENNNLKVISYHLNTIVKTNTYAINSFSELTETWAKNINYFANEVYNKGIVQEKCWDKIKLTDEVCIQCRNMIKLYCNNDDNTKISVGFISYRKDENNNEWVNMIAHSDPVSTRPHSYGEEELLSDCIYHYADLVKEKYSDIEIAVNNEEVLRIFKKVSKNTDLTKYTQYIAVPIYCSSKKLLGIFQIVTKYNYVIEEYPIALRKFAQENIIPFSNMILLIDKINKGLYAKPQEERSKTFYHEISQKEV